MIVFCLISKNTTNTCVTKHVGLVWVGWVWVRRTQGGVEGGSGPVIYLFDFPYVYIRPVHIYMIIVRPPFANPPPSSDVCSVPSLYLVHFLLRQRKGSKNEG